jgi:undecaprenyl-diphosphatase
MTSNGNKKSGVQNTAFESRAPHGLHSPGLFAKYPVIGLTMFLVGGLLFGVLAYQIGVNKSLLQWDMAVAKTFRAAQIDAPWSWMENILFGLFVGKELVVVIGGILAAYFLHKRFWRELVMVLTGLGGGALLWYFLGRYFERPRPSDHLDVLTLSGPSFPSGPALLAVVCYGLLAYLLVASLPSRFWKWVSTLLLALAIAIVAVSSLLFGTHFPSDVIAGYALGLAWAGVAYTLVERVFAARTVRDPSGRLESITFDGLRSPRLFKRRPVIGIALIILAALSFAALGYNLLTKGPLLQMDTSVYQALLGRARAAPPAVNDLMLFGFFVGKQAIQLIVALLSLYFLYHRYWAELAIIQLSTNVGGLLWNFFIDYFSRPRPPEQLGLVITTLPSFPSGHALGTMICYGFLAYLLVPRMPSLFWKWTVGLAMLFVVLFEGFSRVFHANHYLTDVLAGYALGIFCLVLLCMLIELIFLRNLDKARP